ncbi:hypothetical protein [Pseudomonas lopnurensis]|uniref:hypothetical protein n=1 Tax=Pseudomonas lopnurensis TaxID=1477517 RepID=UPI0028ABD778|nr:hypothetical protein [Pseudomonas lopnurensis]
MPAFKLVLWGAAAAWPAYNLWRVFTAPQNAIEVSAAAHARCPRSFAFQTYMEVREYYKQLSSGHRKYVMSGGERLMEDVVIDVWETAGFQFVKHRYRVTELIPDRRMRLLSEHSEVRVLWLFKGRSRSEVEFRFDDAAANETSLGLTIRIVFANRLRHLVARLFFTEAIWAAHAREEMKALARMIERRYKESETPGTRVDEP